MRGPGFKFTGYNFSLQLSFPNMIEFLKKCLLSILQYHFPHSVPQKKNKNLKIKKKKKQNNNKNGSNKNLLLIMFSPNFELDLLLLKNNRYLTFFSIIIVFRCLRPPVYSLHISIHCYVHICLFVCLYLSVPLYVLQYHVHSVPVPPASFYVCPY